MDSEIEILGYVASVLICISLCMTDMKHLRWFNLTGSFLFALYGYYKSAYPVMLLNGILTLVNIYHLWRINMKRSPY